MTFEQITPETMAIRDIIDNSQKILITYFSATDGDSLGSMLALSSILKKLGKDVTCFVHDNVPENFGFLPNLNEITQTLDKKGSLIISLKCIDGQIESIKYMIEGDKVNIHVTPKDNISVIPENISFGTSHNDNFDLIIAVDSSDKKQMGETLIKYKEVFENTPIINIDHHESNEMYGTMNLVEKTSASTTQVLYKFLKLWEKTKSLIDPDTATFLLMGLISDTGSFQHANTTPQSLDTAAELVELGARQQDIIKNLFKMKKMSQLKLWGEILSRVTHDKENRVLWSYVKLTDYDSTGSNSDEIAGIIDDLLGNAPDTDFVILFKETEDRGIRVSIRSTSDEHDCTKIALAFGGGGHKRAAGCGIQGTLEEAMQKVLTKLKEIK